MMRKLLLLLLLICVGLTSSITMTLADTRVALVIGNSKYRNISVALTNPSNDAQDIAAVLTELGFDVVTATDATKSAMEEALQNFARKATDAESALFYYAGHAMQYQGRNYLMPIDAELEDEFSLRYRMIAMDDVRAALDRSNGVKIVILDSCRNNPLADRFLRLMAGQTRNVGQVRGLARVDKTQGMVVAYATAADQVALDGDGRNSPYTSALLKRMQDPGLEVELMFRKVAADVNEETGGKQRPETYVSLLSEYYLNQSDKLAWEKVKDSGDIAAIRDFIARFPNSVQRFNATRRLEVLELSAREREEQSRLNREALQRQQLEQRLAEMEAERTKDELERRKLAEASSREEQQKRVKAEEERRLAAREESEREELRRREEKQNLERIEEEQRKAAREMAERVKTEEQQEAAKRYAELEAELRQAKREIAEREAARQRQIDEAQKVERVCREETTRLESIGSEDITKLKDFSGQAECGEIRAAVMTRIAAIEARRAQEEQICKREEEMLKLLQANGVEGHEKLADLTKLLTCERLRPYETTASITTKSPTPTDTPKTNPPATNTPELIRSAQVELRRLGCFSGPADGQLTKPTRDAVLRYFKFRGHGGADVVITDSVLSDIKTVTPGICANIVHEASRPKKKSKSAETRTTATSPPPTSVPVAERSGARQAPANPVGHGSPTTGIW